MNRRLRPFLICALIASILFAAAYFNPAQAKRYSNKNRFASIVIEADTGYVLSHSNADKKLYPASLTKMMTLYLTFEALKHGKLRKSQYLKISNHAAAQVPSSLGLRRGDRIRVRHAILALVTKSANDVAVSLAETLGGSEKAFAKLMTAKAKELV